MGSSEAFYTFLCEKPRGRKFIVSYVLWQLFQFLLPMLIVAFILPDKWISQIWLGDKRETILLAFMAVFMQQQAWQTMIHIGESLRLTYKIHSVNLAIYFLQFVIMSVLWKLNIIGLKIIFGVIFLEYILAVLFAYRLIKSNFSEKVNFDGKVAWNEYRAYCQPLITYSILAFGYGFVDRWFLQNFSGSLEQSFYAIGYQFASVCLVATTSMVKIFWKEIAEAHESRSHQRIHNLYRKASRFLYFVSVVFCGFLLPWSEEIILHTLGISFVKGSAILAIMLLFPIHQSMGYVDSTLFMASKRTNAQLTHGAFIMFLSIPVSYLLQAPKDAWIPGFALGGVGLAWKMVVLGVIHSNTRGWQNAKDYGWKFDWSYQIITLIMLLPLGWMAYQVSMQFDLHLIIQIFLSLIVYTISISSLVWVFPWVVGFTQDEIKNDLRQLFK